MNFFSAAFRVIYKIDVPRKFACIHAGLDVREGGGGTFFFLKIDFFWYNSWGRMDPTLTVSIPHYGSCIYSSELF